MLPKSNVMCMKFLYYPLIALFLGLNMACNEIPSKAEVDIVPPKEATVETTPRLGSKSPTIWHNPKTLTQRLGDLSDKTVANIGAGPYGYFSIEIADEAKKVIAIDIDPEAIHFIDSMRQQLLPLAIQDNLETRLVVPNNPKLRFEEVDVVTIRETYAYLPNRLKYLKTLRKGIKDGGKLLIVDFKMRKLPEGPPQSEKVPLFQVERELEQAGYRIAIVDDLSLAYQYIVVAIKE